MVKHTLEILRSEHGKLLAIFSSLCVKSFYVSPFKNGADSINTNIYFDLIFIKCQVCLLLIRESVDMQKTHDKIRMAIVTVMSVLKNETIIHIGTQIHGKISAYWLKMHPCVDIIRGKALMLNQGVSRWKCLIFNPLSANPTKWSNTLKQFVGKSRRIVLSVSVHFVGLALKRLSFLDLNWCTPGILRKAFVFFCVNESNYMTVLHQENL